MAYTSEFPPIYVAVDVVLLTVRDSELQVLLVRRGSTPYKGWLALPGGFVRQREALGAAASRELVEETGVRVKPSHLEQLATYGGPRRDPRARTVSVAYFGVLPSMPEPVAGTDAASAGWFPVDSVLSRRLAFDHAAILRDGVERCRSKLEYTPLATAFCGDTFTVKELRLVYEAVWGETLEPGNFHRKVTRLPGFIELAGEKSTRSPGRPAGLYRRGPAEMLMPPLLRTGST